MRTAIMLLLSFVLLLATAIAQQQPSPTPSPTASASPSASPSPSPSPSTTPRLANAGVGGMQSPPTTNQETPVVFWICAIAITLFLLLILFAIFIGLSRSPSWFLGEAISEEAGNQPNPLPAGQKPILVASSSRLIALLGLMVIMVIYLGFGYCALWRCFMDKSMGDMRSLLSFLFGGASMFAPYMVNQLRDAFSSFAPAASNTPSTAK